MENSKIQKYLSYSLYYQYFIFNFVRKFIDIFSLFFVIFLFFYFFFTFINRRIFKEISVTCRAAKWEPMKQKEVSLNLKETATPPLLPITPPIPVATVSCYISHINRKFQKNSRKIPRKFKKSMIL